MCGSLAPHILKSSTRWQPSSQIHKPAVLPRGKAPSLPTLATSWADLDVLGKGFNILRLPKIETRFLGRPVRSLVPIPTELSRYTKHSSQFHSGLTLQHISAILKRRQKYFWASSQSIFSRTRTFSSTAFIIHNQHAITRSTLAMTSTLSAVT